MGIKLESTGGGVITLEPAVTAVNSTLVLPENGTLATTTVTNAIQTQVDTHMIVPTSYHIYNGGVSIDNTVITNGFSTTLYTGNGTTQSVVTGVDMTTQWGNSASETFGGLVWGKQRAGSSSGNHWFVDTVRGNTHSVCSNLTNAQDYLTSAVTSFNSNGFSLGAGSSDFNNSTSTFASWNFQTTHRKTGVTNHGKAYTEHYNPYTGFTIIKYTGSGTAGHEIPHSLGRKLGMAHFKNLTTAQDWLSYYGVDNMYMALNLTIAGTVGVWSSNETTFNFNSGTGLQYNQSGSEHIMYGWANSYYDENNTLIGNYYGYIDANGVFRLNAHDSNSQNNVTWQLAKNFLSTGNWDIYDYSRGNTKLLYANLSNAESTVSANTLVTTASPVTYKKATDTTNVNINALVPYANGIDVNGSKVSISYKNETISGLTLTQGKNYIYSKNDGTYGSKAYQPQYGSLTNRSVAGENPDYFDLAKQKWFSTSAGTELVTNGTFDSNTTGWTADSSNILSVSSGTMLVNRNNSTANGAKQTIATVIGKQYKIRFKVTSFANSGTSVVYIGTTANASDIGIYANTNTGIFEYLFIAQSISTYLQFGVSTSVTGIVGYDDISVFEATPTIGAEITPRTYLDCIVYADHNGQPTYVEELPKTTYFDEIKANEYKGKNACTAWVNFDGTTTPPTIRDSYNVASVVKISAGIYDIYFKTTMDNVNYTLFGTGYSPSDGYSRSIMRRNGTTPLANKITVMHSTGNAGVVLDSAYIDIQILGGRN